MSSLPPYSTYRTDNKQQMMFPQAISHGNILTFTPPGFNQELNVKFPDSRLAVCEKCKKNYKTRDMCRVRNNHTDPPWTTAYMCITLDDSCTDENGKFIDKPMTVRMVQWQPFCVTKPFDSKHPVCSSCKKTNRTRTFCRERHKHRQLPWCTVYVMLSALESTDPSTVVADPSKPLAEKEEGDSNDHQSTNAGKDLKEEEESSGEAEKEDQPSGMPKEEETEAAQKVSATQGEDETGVIDSDFQDTDDITDIPESRTFLAKVSYKGMSIHWLELADTDHHSEPGPSMGFIVPEAIRQLPAGMDPSQAQYYPQAMGYPPPPQHQQGSKAQKQQQQYYFPPMRGQQQPYPGQPWQPPPYTQQAPGVPQAPVTAGEAAAQQQKQNQGASDGDHQNPGVQWQMMYPPPQMYQMQAGQFGAAPNQGQVEQQEAQNGDLGGELDDDGDDEGPDPKRVRMV